MNAITLIPTAMAYAFIGLLFTILGFIMIYVCHKLYLTIYDSIPLHSAERMRIPREEKELQELREKLMNEAESISEKPIIRESSLRARKRDSDLYGPKAQKTALQIVCKMESCYLAYVSFKTESPHAQRHKILRFYDRLSEIPLGKIMQPCKADKRQELKLALRRLSTVTSVPRNLVAAHSKTSDRSKFEEELEDDDEEEHHGGKKKN